MFGSLFQNVSEEEKNEAIEGIIQGATPRNDFFLMIMLAVAMAVFGVLLNSIIIIIGSMLVAPILYPLLSLSLGIIASDEKLIGRSVYTIAKSVLLALIAGFIIGFFFSTRDTMSQYSLGIVTGAPSLMYAIVAAIAGFAAAFAVTKPHLSEAFPGVAVSVALVPPLAVAGIALAHFDWVALSNALLLFFVNVIGILFSAMIVFSLFRFAVKRHVTQEVVKEEEKVIKDEAKKSQIQK